LSIAYWVLSIATLIIQLRAGLTGIERYIDNCLEMPMNVTHLIHFLCYFCKVAYAANKVVSCICYLDRRSEASSHEYWTTRTCRSHWRALRQQGTADRRKSAPQTGQAAGRGICHSGSGIAKVVFCWTVNGVQTYTKNTERYAQARRASDVAVFTITIHTLTMIVYVICRHELTTRRPTYRPRCVCVCVFVQHAVEWRCVCVCVKNDSSVKMTATWWVLNRLLKTCWSLAMLLIVFCWSLVYRTNTVGMVALWTLESDMDQWADQRTADMYV